MSLRRSLGPLQIQLISLGGIIGSGYFLGLGATLAENGAWALLAYLVGGLIVWLVAMAMGELCVAMPREGGFVTHAHELFGPKWGPVLASGVGWSYWFNWCAYIPSEMIAGGMILNGFFPQISIMAWATVFGLAITAVNLMNVRFFGQIESALALLKIAAIGLFTAIGAWFWIRHFGDATQAIVPSFSEPAITPLSFFAAMVLVLVNFQGTELIALSAAETKDPASSIPKASRNVAIRIIAMYALPIAILIMTYPILRAGVEQSVFAEALSHYGFGNFGLFFKIVIVAAALSCANSGLYGAVRAMYGLGRERLAPVWVTRLNEQSVPARATWLTIAMCWLVLSLYLLFEGSNFYVWLLSLSGFTGAVCWISIAFCQIRLRKLQAKEGVQRGTLYRMPGFPILSWLSVVLQVLCVSLVVFHPNLRTALILGLPAFLIPAGVQWLRSCAARNYETGGQ